MADKDGKPNPIEDIRKGLGLLFRAAKTTIEQLPTDKFEEAVVSSAKEVGRAIENVAQTVEHQLRKPGTKPDEPRDESGAAPAPTEAKPEHEKEEKKDDEPKP